MVEYWMWTQTPIQAHTNAEHTRISGDALCFDIDFPRSTLFAFSANYLCERASRRTCRVSVNGLYLFVCVCVRTFARLLARISARGIREGLEDKHTHTYAHTCRYIHKYLAPPQPVSHDHDGSMLLRRALANTSTNDTGMKQRVLSV